MRVGIWRGGIGCVVDFYFLKWDMGGEVLGVCGRDWSRAMFGVLSIVRVVIEDGQEEQVR